MTTSSKNISRYLEIATNIAIIVVAAIIIWHFVARRLGSHDKPEAPTVGQLVSLPGVTWDNRVTLLLALQKGCRFCEESATFYREIRNQNPSIQLRMLAVIPGEANEIRDYLMNMGISVDDTANVSLSDVKVAATPTLLLIDQSSKVRYVWVGKLDSMKEKEVAQRIGELRSVGRN